MSLNFLPYGENNLYLLTHLRKDFTHEVEGMLVDMIEFIDEMKNLVERNEPE